MTEKQKRRMIMVDDDLWGHAKKGAEEAGISLSAYVRMSLHLALAHDPWRGPFPQGEPWVGFDLDGTLAHYENGYAEREFIGPPIDLMVDRLQGYLGTGINVAIFSARVSNPGLMPGARVAIEDWCRIHLGRVLPVTCRKDYGLTELYDDRAVQVIPNTGRLAESGL